MAVLAACALEPARAADQANTFVLSDGVRMAYVVKGTAEPALVFVHCGNCRMEIWSETLDSFAGAFRVVAMDLPGHGRSTSKPERMTIPGMGAAVAELVEHLGLKKVVLVGNSLGGPTALAAAKRLGKERVAGVVAVDTLQNVELVWPEESFRKVLEGYRQDFQATCNGMMLGLLPTGASDAVRARIDRDTCDDDPKAMLALMEAFRSFDQAAAMRDAGVPVRAINSTAYPTSVEVNRRYSPTFDVILMDGVGHYPQVERPEEFQANLRRVVKDLAGR
ncbi:MAG: alpha/beta fold hydrolase [Candidatus Polarisedimenticolia bacterium]